MGQCSRCGEWNTISEEIVESKGPAKRSGSRLSQKKGVQSIRDIRSAEADRILLADDEFSRLTGGGLVPGSVLLLGGEPGIGKSTLMLQLALAFPKEPVLYVSGEESLEQVKMRAERVAAGASEVMLLPETEVDSIVEQMRELQPGLCIVDSVQTLVSPELESAPGTVSQIRESSHRRIQEAKRQQIPLILIGHITKEGQLAGPKVLEHMVDVVLQFEGDRHHIYRLLRSLKNRYGSTAELGIYEMRQQGLQPVNDPSRALVGKRDASLSGVALGLSMEGARPLLVETQALVSTAVYGTPQRSTTGFDTRRLNMLLAVLEKRCGFRLGTKDVFLNITGGLRVDDPALDLAVACAVLSSGEDLPIDTHAVFCGEIGLGGEIRPVSHIDRRLSEAAKLGYTSVYLSEQNAIDKAPKGVKLHHLKRVDEAFGQLFG